MNKLPSISFKIIPPDDIDVSALPQTSTKFKSQQPIQEQFYAACKMGNPDKVLHTLTNKDLPEVADINKDRDYGLFLACMYANFPVVKFLLTSPKLQVHANINARDSGALEHCLMYNKLEIAKFLLTSPLLKERAKIHTKKDDIFIRLCKAGKIESIMYLVCDYEIKYTKNIDKWLHCPEAETFAHRDEILHLFQTRGFRDNLQKKLPHQQEAVKRTKI